MLGGQPFRALRLSGPASLVVRRWQHDREVRTSAETVLARRLHVAGLAVHRCPTPWTADDVTVVVPAFGRASDLARCLRALEGPRVLVVDDATPHDAVQQVTAAHGATYLHLKVNAGPAAARNAGLRRVTTPLVAFVDSDVVVSHGWLGPLLAALTEDVAAVAPRVVGAGGRSLLARYESGAGPLDLGARAGPVAPGARVGHVPAAALLCRVSDLDAGFDEGMRVGEDVDLVWRLVASGRQVRYEPRVIVTHTTREALSAWLGQRHGYGRSAAALDVRHPGRVAPVVVGHRAAPVLAAALTRRPGLVALALAAGSAGLHRRLPYGSGRVRAAARLSVQVPARSAMQIADGAARTWLPVLLPVALVSPRARAATAVAVTVRLVCTCRCRPGLDPVRGAGLRVLEDLAYACGVWRGALAHRRTGAAAPRLSAPRGTRPALLPAGLTF